MTSFREFQAVVLAGGKGSRMTDLTSSKPKCLLPIGNLPMICYPLGLLQRIGFKEVIVVTQECAKSEVASLPKKYQIDLSLDIVTVPSDDDLGTADALRSVHDKLKADRIMIVSGDLVTDFDVHELVDLHRVHRSSVTALFTTKSLDPRSVHVPGPKSKVSRERDFVGIDLKSNGQLCYLSSEADLEEKEEVSLKRSILQEHPSMTIHTNLVDAHFYIFEKWICDFVASDDKFAVIKGELMPYLVRKQFSKTMNNDHLNGGTFPEDENAETPNPKAVPKTGLESFVTMDKMAEQTRDLSSWNDHIGDLKDAYRGRPLRCYAYIMEGGTCMRANNMYTYCELNRRMTSLLNTVAPPNTEQVLIHPNSQIQPKAQLGLECMVGANTLISDKTTIKNCVLGSNCKVEEKVRLTDCIIMDNVVVKSGCNVQGSLLCDGVVLAENCDIKDCVVSKVHVFSEGAKHSKEVLVEMEI